MSKGNKQEDFEKSMLVCSQPHKHTLRFHYQMLEANDCRCLWCDKNIITAVTLLNPPDLDFDISDIKPPVMGKWKIKRGKWEGYWGHGLFCCMRCLQKYYENKKLEEDNS